jgi:signal transduction histidine kinase
MARLTAPIAAVSLILLAIAIGAAWYIRNTQEAVTGLMKDHARSVRAAQGLETTLQQVQVHVYQYISGGKVRPEAMEEYRQRSEEHLQTVREFAQSSEERGLLLQVENGYREYWKQYDELTRKEPPVTDKASLLYKLNDEFLKEEVLSPLREFRRLNEGMLTKSTEANHEMAQRLTLGLIGLGVCGAAGGLLAGWVIASTLRRSMLQTEEALRTTAERLNKAVNLPEPPPKPDESPLERVTQSASAVLLRLKQTERDALRAEQLAWAGQMAAGIAHEVRNPLMAIKLLVQAASMGRRATPFRPRDLEVLEEEILRVEEIVSMFLDFARPARPDKKHVEARSLLQSSLERVQSRAELQNVKIRLDAPDEPLMLDADPNQIRQVMYNLLFNALDVLPSGGEITVRLDSAPIVEGTEPFVVIEVEDTGPGLSPELTDRIFDPFVSTKETGLGLGLSICRRIVEAHGGAISGETRPGSGARFTVRLPASQAAVVEDGTASKLHPVS